jgi:signal transduction histidine kinase
MKWYSLRLRLIAGGIVAILIALAIAGGGLVLLFERHVARTLADDLDVHLKQLLAGIDVDAQGNIVLTQPPADPRFTDPLSGLYWQISGDRGQVLRSRSLWDTTMTLPADELAPGEIHQHEVRGPAGARMLVAERAVNLGTGDRHVAVRVAVAADLVRVGAATSAFARELAVALGVLGCVLAIATSIQVALGLRPLDALRRGVADIRAGRIRRLPAAVPSEVEPLVEEVNALVDAQAAEIERSRSRAADLAHGLKTPLAALNADAARLHEGGEHVIAREIEAVVEAMSRHVDREMARARVRALRGADVSTELKPLAESLIATLARTPAGKRVTFEARISENVHLPIDRTDLAEVLGNLLENAARHAAALVRITVRPGLGPPISIEDDGKGLAPSQLSRVLERGARLDERGEGAGLGLAIVQDVLDAYDWRLDLAGSDLGGLSATIGPKVPPGRQLAHPATSLTKSDRIGARSIALEACGTLLEVTTRAPA